MPRVPQSTTAALRSCVVALACAAAAAAPLGAQSRGPAGVRPDARATAPRPGAGRTVTFETTEGTGMNVDVAPDGRTLVFDLVGDLYTVSITGGPATRLTSGPAFDTEPVFSPDGRRIAFVSDRGGVENIWVVEASGRHPRAFTRDTVPVTDPEWLAGGGEFVLAARRAGAPWRYRADGSGVALQSKVARPVSTGAGLTAWSRDGHFLYELLFEEGQLWRLDVARGLRELLSEFDVPGFRPVVSPDSRTVVFAFRRDVETGLRLFDVATQASRELRYPLPDRDLSAIMDARRAAWPRFAFTPDGQALVLATGGQLQKLSLRTGRLAPIPFRARVEQTLAVPGAPPRRALAPAAAAAATIREVQRAPTGPRTVFEALDRLWVQEGAGTPRLLLEPPPYQLLREPALSPDGRSVAYVSWHDADGGQLWRVALEGGPPQPLTRRRGVYRHPVWSPDGSRLAVVREEETNPRARTGSMRGEVYVVPAAGGALHHVRAIGAEERPQFAPDGDSIVVVKEASAQDRTTASAALALPWPGNPSGALALEGATVITMRGAEVLRDATVLITGQRIAAVGARRAVAVPAGARRLDVTGTTIIPGLIDASTEIAMVRDVLEGTNIPLAAHLSLGVTTVSARPTGAAPAQALALAARYRERLEAGTLVGPRLLVRGEVSAATLTDLESTRAELEWQQAAGAIAIKPTGPLTRRQQQWLAQAAAAVGVTLVGQSQDLRQSLTCLIDGCGILERNIPNAQLYDDMRQLFAASGAAYAPVLVDALPSSLRTTGTAAQYFGETTNVRTDPLIARFALSLPSVTRWLRAQDYAFLPASRQAAELARARVPLLAATTGKGPPGLGLHWEIWALERGGLSRHEALRAATATAAKILGVENQLGVIAPGALADLVVLDANPLADLRRTRDIRYVVRSGALFEAATLAQLWPRSTPPPPLRDPRYDPPAQESRPSPDLRRIAAGNGSEKAATPAGRVQVGPAPAVPRMPDSLLFKPARTISVETDEFPTGDFALSPDGTTLVFAYLGDLYTLPVTGGQARQLTRGLPVETSPRWSPDGQRIAFISDASGVTNFWVMAADGSGARPVAPERLPAPYGPYDPPTSVEWTPDGRSLLSWNRLVHLAGGEETLVFLPAKSPGSSAPQARYSADGRYLYLLANGLRRYDRQTGTGMQLANPPGLGGFGVVSPDGHRLAYIAGYRSPGTKPTIGLRLLDLESGEDRLLAYPITGSGERSLAFTPDSKTLLSAHGGQLHRLDLATGAVALIPFSLTTQTDLGPFVYHTRRVANEPLLRVRYITNPAVSPDGQEVVFSALQRLYRMRLPKGRPQPLLATGPSEVQNAGQFDPVYSPDGRWLAFVTWQDGRGGHLWKMPARGGGPPVRLTAAPAFYTSPAWSPDGTTLAVIRRGPKDARSGGRTDPAGVLLVLPSRGGPARRVIDAVRSPLTFTRDGARILYNTGGYSTVGDDPSLASISLDGRERRVLAQAPEDGYGQMKLWPSPDERYVAYKAKAGEIYLAPWPRGPEPVRLPRFTGPAAAAPAPAPSPAPSSVPESVGGAIPAVRLAPGLDPRWDADGQALTWVSGPTIYRVNPDAALAQGAQGVKAQPKPVQLAERDPVSFPWVLPDPAGEIELTVPRSLPTGTVALRGVRAVTLRGDEVIENATLVVTHDRIAAIGPASEVRIPVGAKVLELRGTTVIPGFIDMHSHADWQAHELFYQEKPYFRATLAYGVTSVREVSGAPAFFDAAERVETGDIVGSRVFHDGHHFNGVGHWFESLEDARLEIQHLKRMGATVIKEYEGRTRRQTQWVLQAADEAGLNVTAHDGLFKVIDGMTGQEHAAGGSLFYAAAGTWFTTTWFGQGYYNPRYHLFDDLKYRRFGWNWEAFRGGGDDTTRFSEARAFREQIRARGKATMGSHGNTPGIGMHFDVWINQHFGGLTPLEALRAASLFAAEGLGVQQDLGSLEVGKLADLIVLDKNPLEDIEHTLAIRYVMKNGVLYDDETLDVVWPARRPPGALAKAKH